MKKYVLGFAFDAFGMVGLIEKARPDWQAGSLNGIGGHIEPDDASPHAAMVREFEEETGVLVPAWEEYVSMGNNEWHCTCFRAFDVPLNDMRTLTDEEVFMVTADLLPNTVLFNLRWLIPLALDKEPAPSFVAYPDAR